MDKIALSSDFGIAVTHGDGESHRSHLVTRHSALVAIFLVLCTMLFANPTHATDRLTVKDAPGGSTVFRVDSGGTVEVPGGFIWDNVNKRLGIATANPQSSLHLVDNSTSGSRGLIAGQHNDGPQAGVIVLRKSRGSETSPSAVVQGDYIATIHAQAYDGTEYLSNISTGSISFLVDGPVSTGVIPTGMSFQTGSTPLNKAERIRVTSGGNIGIGVSTPTHLLQLSGGAYSDGSTWINASSRALKTNIKDLSADEAMNAFLKLEPVTFNYKTDAEQNRVGFIAEDVPSLVATKDRKGLSAMDIVAVLTKVVQEQQQTISDLSKKVAELQKEVRMKNGFASN